MAFVAVQASQVVVLGESEEQQRLRVGIVADAIRCLLKGFTVEAQKLETQ